MTQPKPEIEIIIETLGGFGKLKAMIAASSFVYDNEEISIKFKFKSCKKFNWFKVKYDYASDLYDVTFYKISGRVPEVKAIKELTGVYNDQLVSIFEETTGLYLHF